MKIFILNIFTLLLFLNCGSSTSSKTPPNPEINSGHEDWDRHQFFDDQPWTTLDSLGHIIELADSIVAYNWNDNDGNPANVFHHIVDAYGKFDDRVGKTFLLNESQKSTLKNLLSDSIHYEGANTMSFIPHIAFVYFKESKIIGQSNVSFLCSGVKSVPKSTKALNYDGATKLRSLCKEIGLKIIDSRSQTTQKVF